MDNGGDGNPPASDQAQRQLSISLAASTMIRASDQITAEAYQANLKRIQEVKEMVHKLEMNNEAAHKNFLVDQLQKRAQEGREAEDMLTRLRNQPGLPETVHLTNNPPSDRPEVILPTTATVVEVPESRSPQTVQQGRQWNYPPQLQPYSPAQSQFYVPPIHHNAAPYTQAPVHQGQLYTPQNQPLQSKAQTGFQVQQPHSWSGYPPPVVALPAAMDIGYPPSPAGWVRAPPAHGGPSGGPSNPTYREQGASRPPDISHSQPPNFTSRGQGVPAIPVAPFFGQAPHTSSLPKPVEQSRSIPHAVSKPLAISELQHRHKPPKQPQRHQPPPTATVQEQAQQRGTQLPAAADQATFIQIFHNAVRRGVLPFKAFWCQAKAAGINDGWFKMAIDSLPRNVWQSFVAQVHQSESTLDTAPPANSAQQQVMIPRQNVSSVNAPSHLTTIPLGQIAPATQQATKPSISTEAQITDSGSKQHSQPYAALLQYYAEEATKSVHFAQGAGVSETSPRNIVPPQTMFATPQRDVPQVQINARTPKDANRSTLARDVLRALRNGMEKPRQEIGGEIADKVNNHAGDQPPEVSPSQPISQSASAKPPAAVVSLATSSVDADSLSTASANPNVPDEPHCVTPSCQSIAKMALKEEEENRQVAVIEGPIMIDLTLDDTDEFVDGKGEKSTFPVRCSASAVISSRPASPTNTTNQTPLLESLSLVEPSVDVAGSNDNADVRMRSPRLSLANMESGHPYPPDNAELVSGFEPLPSEPNEHPLDGQLPLFLPSPSVSPAPTERPATDPGMITDEGESRPSLKRHSVEVDKMETDTEMGIPSRIRKRRNRVYVFIPPAPLYVKKAKAKAKERAIGADTESELEGVGQDEELPYSHLERLLVEESRLRLLERRCRWLNCDAILNCAANLFAHLKNHAREKAIEGLFICRWVACQRQFSTEQERDIHLERHATRPLPCPFAGCSKQFDRPVEVMQHEVQHPRGEPLVHKLTCRPIVPGIPARLGPPPQWLPSHRVIARRVAKCQISAERHAVVGPWVLWNIFGPVDLHMKKQNASMRGRPTRQATNCEMDARQDDYDFLLALSSYPGKSTQLDDLDSTVITMSAAQGLTLWGAPDEEDAAERMLAL